MGGGHTHTAEETAPGRLVRLISPGTNQRQPLGYKGPNCTTCSQACLLCRKGTLRRAKFLALARLNYLSWPAAKDFFVESAALEYLSSHSGPAAPSPCCCCAEVGWLQELHPGH